MNWQEAREQYPDKWLLFSAINSYIHEFERRIVRELTPIQAFENFYTAHEYCLELRKESLDQHYYIYHTSNVAIKIRVESEAYANYRRMKFQLNAMMRERNRRQERNEFRPNGNTRSIINAAVSS